MRSVLEHLRGQIITCQLKAGQRLNENQLSSELNVSRPPLREAFQVLEQEGFVISIPRKGRYVSEITWSNYEKIHAARCMIECHVIDLLKERNLRNFPDLDLTLTMIPKNPTPSNDPIENLHYIETMDDFHAKLVSSIHSEILDRFYGIIKFNICRYHYWLRVLRLPGSLHPDMLKSLTQEHCNILDLIKRGKFDEAKDCLKHHMDGTWELMKKHLLGIEVGRFEALLDSSVRRQP